MVSTCRIGIDPIHGFVLVVACTLCHDSVLTTTRTVQTDFLINASLHLEFLRNYG